VPPLQVQDLLRRWFERWGMPAELRLDNGLPWATLYQLPTAIELWLAGLGVSVLFNPPGRPQHNGVVERSHGTLQRWADFKECPDFLELQRRVLQADLIQRERYPALAGKSRLEAFPELAVPHRAYSRPWEEENWDMEKAKELLEAHVAYRQVMSKGQIKVYKRRIQVGRENYGKTVLVRYDAASECWTVSRADGSLLRSVSACDISRSSILTLSISDRD
jgi:hypothetical protein